MCSPSPTPCPRPSLASILVRSERRVDWRRRSSLADSVCDDDVKTSPATANVRAHCTNTPCNNEEHSNAAPFSARSRTVTFAQTIKQRRIPGLADMDREEIASLWRTPIDRSQCTSHIADTVRVVRSTMRYRDQGIGGGASYDETLYCERGIEVYLDEKYKQKLMHKRKLIVVSVLSKQEELRQRNFDPTKKDAKFRHENELANLATTISRDSVKSARIRAKQDLFAARGVIMSNQQPSQPSTSSSSSPPPPPPPSSSTTSASSSTTPTTTTTRFGGMASAARSLSWNRRNALSALKRDNSRRLRERHQFVGQARRMSRSSDSDSSDGSAKSRGSSPSVAAAGGRCRAAKMA